MTCSIPKRGSRSSSACELLARQTFRTYREARTALFAYIEVFSNRQRRHSALDYLAPDAYERRWATQTAVVA
jgi:putative transposase